MLAKVFCSILVALGLVATAASADEQWSPLIEPAALDRLVENDRTVVIDIRSPKAFAAGHVPGAVNLPYPSWRGPKHNPGALISDTALTALLSGAGIEPHRPVVVTYAGSDVTNFGAAARVYWTLKSAGVLDIAILNGGLAAWRAAELSLTTEPTPVAPNSLSFSISERWKIDRGGIADVVGGARSALLVDARPESFFEGRQKHPLARLAGTLAGAANISHSSWFSEGAARLDVTRRAARMAAWEAGWRPDGPPLVSFCNTGHWAATNWFVLSEIAGIDGVRLYPESLVGWTSERSDLVRQ